MTAPTNISIELNWSRLLGFDQATPPNGPTVTAAKVGEKDVLRRKPIAALCAKVGNKPTIMVSVATAAGDHPMDGIRSRLSSILAQTTPTFPGGRPIAALCAKVGSKDPTRPV